MKVTPIYFKVPKNSYLSKTENGLLPVEVAAVAPNPPNVEPPRPVAADVVAVLKPPNAGAADDVAVAPKPMLK